MNFPDDGLSAYNEKMMGRVITSKRKSIDDIKILKKQEKHTCIAMSILMSVRNCVTRSPTLAGVESTDIRKLISDTPTIAVHGR